MVMESSLSFIVLTAILFSSTLWFIYSRFLVPKIYPSEPPILNPRVPYIGHILGLLQYGADYYSMVTKRAGQAIFTLPMGPGKVYIVTNPDLVSQVNRNSKSLAFNPFIAALGMRITGHDAATSDIVQNNLNGENGGGYVTQVHEETVATLSPGKMIEQMVPQMLKVLDGKLGNLDKGGEEVNMFRWLRDALTGSITTAIYGDDNPLTKRPELENLFWDFDHSLSYLIADILPKYIAPKGDHARAQIGKAFEEYYGDFNYETTTASPYARARSSVGRRWGVTSRNQGKLEVGTLLGVLANTVPSAFWMLAHIYSQPALLKAIRDEIETRAVQKDPSGTKTLKIKDLRNKCVLLHSSFQEVLRLHAAGASVRLVREDTWITTPSQGSWLLKKDGVVMMPMKIMHLDPATWGPNVAVFDAARFLREDGASVSAGAVSGGSSKNGAAYRPFGGGASMCPGRHFVTLEIMAFAAWLVMRFDVEPVGTDGEWRLPGMKQESLATNVFPPDGDVKVRVVRRSQEAWSVDVE